MRINLHTTIHDLVFPTTLGSFHRLLGYLQCLFPRFCMNEWMNEWELRGV